MQRGYERLVFLFIHAQYIWSIPHVPTSKKILQLGSFKVAFSCCCFFQNCTNWCTWLTSTSYKYKKVMWCVDTGCPIEWMRVHVCHTSVMTPTSRVNGVYWDTFLSNSNVSINIGLVDNSCVKHMAMFMLPKQSNSFELVAMNFDDKIQNSFPSLSAGTGHMQNVDTITEVCVS